MYVLTARLVAQITQDLIRQRCAALAAAAPAAAGAAISIAYCDVVVAAAAAATVAAMPVSACVMLAVASAASAAAIAAGLFCLSCAFFTVCYCLLLLLPASSYFLLSESAKEFLTIAATGAGTPKTGTYKCCKGSAVVLQLWLVSALLLACFCLV